MSTNAYYENANFCKFSDIEKARIGQRGAVNCIIDRVVFKQEKLTSLVLPTRYGKSDVIRLSAIELVEQKQICGALLVTPCIFLRDQMVDKKKIEEMTARYLIRSSRPITYSKLNHFHLNIFENREYFESITTQMLSKNIDQICEWIKKQIKDTGLPPAIFIDETHTGSEDNSWGDCVPKLAAAGAFVILLTATACRADGSKIHGFEFIVEDTKTYFKTVPRDHDSDKDKVVLEKYEIKEAKTKLVPNYEYTFKRAWAEGNVLCQFNRHPINVDYTHPKLGVTKEICEYNTDIRSFLGDICRDDKVIQAGCEWLVELLEVRRESKKDATAIVFCGNDNAEYEEDHHAKHIKKRINLIRPSLDIKIATMKTEESAAAIIQQFKEGKGDVLIVKQMASLGLDVPHMKVLLDLSSVRTEAACIQKWNRVSTPHGTTMNCDVIMPNDIFSFNLFDRFITEQGGEMKTIKSTFIDEEERLKNKKDESGSEKGKVVKAFMGDFSDTDKEKASSQDFAYVKTLTRLEPALNDSLSHVRIVALAKRLESAGADFAKLIDSTPKVFDNNQIIKQLHFDINELTRKLANLKHTYKPDASPEALAWTKAKREAFGRAKKHVGIGLAHQLKNIRNIDHLQRMKTFLEKELSIVPDVFSVPMMVS